MSRRVRRRDGPLRARPEVWRSLDDGARLRAGLEHFYARVFEDPALAPFFTETGVTRRHVVDKQFNFLRDLLTGDGSYFGNRPRNAHHWMVISEALFDHREALLQDSLAACGVPPLARDAIREIDEVFRKQIVKDRPIPRRMGGITFPLDGVEEMEMPLGTVCDACGDAVEAGDRVRYHVRTGRTWCLGCAPAP